MYELSPLSPCNDTTLTGVFEVVSGISTTKWKGLHENADTGIKREKETEECESGRLTRG
jgi:hypothetical protein